MSEVTTQLKPVLQAIDKQKFKYCEVKNAAGNRIALFSSANDAKYENPENVKSDLVSTIESFGTGKYRFLFKVAPSSRNTPFCYDQYVSVTGSEVIQVNAPVMQGESVDIAAIEKRVKSQLLAEMEAERKEREYKEKLKAIAEREKELDGWAGKLEHIASAVIGNLVKKHGVLLQGVKLAGEPIVQPEPTKNQDQDEIAKYNEAIKILSTILTGDECLKAANALQKNPLYVETIKGL